MIEIVASNIGGTATLIGDPPNILIAGATGLSFTAFIVNLAPVAAVTFVLVTGGLYLVSGACFGGNATLIAAAANVAAAGMAARAGRPIGFLYFLRIGLPVTLVSMIMATAYIALRYL